MTPSLAIGILAALIVLAVWRADAVFNWIVSKFVPRLDDEAKRKLIEEWNRRHGR